MVRAGVALLSLHPAALKRVKFPSIPGIWANKGVAIGVVAALPLPLDCVHVIHTASPDFLGQCRGHRAPRLMRSQGPVVLHHSFQYPDFVSVPLSRSRELFRLSVSIFV